MNYGLERDPVLKTFPGAVSISKLSESDLERLDERSKARGVRGHLSPPRAVSEAAELDAYCEWVAGHGLDLIGVVTFTDEYAQRHNIFSLSRAVDDVASGLRSIHCRRGDSRGFVSGFPFSYVLAGEFHRTGRAVPHVHLALESRGSNQGRLLRELRGYFDGSRGRSRFEVMRDRTAGTYYGLKDTIKSVKHDSDAIYLRLLRPRDRSGRFLLAEAEGGELHG